MHIHREKEPEQVEEVKQIGRKDCRFVTVNSGNSISNLAS